MKTIPRDDCWFITFTGIRFHPLSPKPEDISLVDIAHALSQVNRFGGHTRIPYSVAAHSILVSQMLPGRLRLQGLLHDAAEAYLGDMISPVKACVPEFRRMEKNLFKVIAQRFGIPATLDPLVKEADLAALKAERDAFIRKEGSVWPVDTKVFDIRIVELSPPEFATAQHAADFFRNCYYELCPPTY